jgi:hypothetical protein
VSQRCHFGVVLQCHNEGLSALHPLHGLHNIHYQAWQIAF